MIVVDRDPAGDRNQAQATSARATRRGWMRMDSQSLLHEISGYCRRVGMAESTFGRLSVNDGKLVSRLRFGGRITTDTAERVRSFIASDQRRALLRRRVLAAANGAAGVAAAPVPAEAAPAIDSDKNFRFYDNR